MTTDTGSVLGSASQQRWRGWPMLALERLPIPYAVQMGVLAAAGVLYAGVSTWLKSEAAGAWQPADLREGLVITVVCLFILTHLRILKRAAAESLAQLRDVVQVADEEYEGYARRMLRADGRKEGWLLALAVALFLLLYVVPADEMRMLPRATALDWAALVLVSVYPIIAAWLLLTLIHCAIRSARALGALARRPLVVNVFDPNPLLPFGRLALLYSLAAVGVVLIPILLLGPPTRGGGGGYLVLGLSAVSLAALFGPLWGVHQQIVRARMNVLGGLADELMAIQASLLQQAGAETGQLKALHERTDVLMGFRKHVLAGPSWPFRDFGAIARVVTALLSPVLVTLISLFVQNYVFPFLTQQGP